MVFIIPVTWPFWTHWNVVGEVREKTSYQSSFGKSRLSTRVIYILKCKWLKGVLPIPLLLAYTFFLLFCSPRSPVVPGHNPPTVDKLESDKKLFYFSPFIMRFHWNSLPQASECAWFLGAEKKTRTELIFINVIKITLSHRQLGKDFKRAVVPGTWQQNLKLKPAYTFLLFDTARSFSCQHSLFSINSA